MGNTENKIRHIYCIEGNWNKHPHSNQSIKPILDLLFTFSKIKYIYKKCITKRDFIKGLQSFTQKRYSNYTVLYIAYHGRKNRICIGNEYITLKEIADVLEDKLNGIIVHFGSCSTLNTTEKNITDFIKRTGCALISGYKKDVPYIDEGGNLAASKIRNLECPSYEICLIDYGCGKFNRKIHIMEQYP